jgi:RNA polymerase sigma-70 factor, ECF subfamily
MDSPEIGTTRGNSWPQAKGYTDSMEAHVTGPPQDALWAELMHAAQDGDRRCYERLLREVTPFVRSLARRHCRNPADVEEIVQETLLTVHRVRQTYDHHRPFSPWLAAIASRRIIDTVRKRSRVSRHETTDTETETFAVAATNNDVELVRSEQEIAELLATLPARQRVALEALKLKELTLVEASAASGQSVGALKVNVHRALKSLRDLVRARERK